MPPQAGRTAIVTGGSGGLGYETAKALAAASVTIAADRVEKATAALERVRAEVGEARVTFVRLDAGDLDSVRRFADEMQGRIERLDILVNCAGVIGPPARETSSQGFEKTLAVDYLGHFALTGRLLGKLKAAPAARVVNYASLMHRQARIDFDDLQGERGYAGMRAYGQAKLAMLLFARELDRRARAAGLALRAMPVHPGGAATDIFRRGAAGDARRLSHRLAEVAIGALGQKADQGALPGLYAATAPDAQGGQYYGPDGFMELRGFPAPAKASAHARDDTVAQRLWAVSEQLTGVSYGFA